MQEICHLKLHIFDIDLLTSSQLKLCVEGYTYVRIWRGYRGIYAGVCV